MSTIVWSRSVRLAINELAIWQYGNINTLKSIKQGGGKDRNIENKSATKGGNLCGTLLVTALNHSCIGGLSFHCKISASFLRIRSTRRFSQVQMTRLNYVKVWSASVPDTAPDVAPSGACIKPCQMWKGCCNRLWFGLLCSRLWSIAYICTLVVARFRCAPCL